jgi:hypothetical protein
MMVHQVFSDRRDVGGVAFLPRNVADGTPRSLMRTIETGQRPVDSAADLTILGLLL